jgi:glycosyltransferase involved in cell wall biosynthesis
LTSWLAAKCIGSLPPAFGGWLGRRGLQGGLWTALRMTELVQLHHETMRAFLAEADHVVAVCDWVRQVLLRNGVADTQITLCRQAITIKAESGSQKSVVSSQSSEVRPPSSVLRVCFLGRLDLNKGIHILVQAIRSIPQAALQLDIYGVAQGEAGRHYEQTLRHLANGDDRVKFCPPVPAAEIIATLKNYDLLAVPSQCLETGPLVVLEAFAAGVPVLGSRLGGIAELVRDGENGMLVEAHSVAAWAAALERIGREPELASRLRAGIKPPHTMSLVADEMMGLYTRLMAR